MNHISNLLNQNYKFQNIVEIGCGDGKMLFELSKKYNSKSIIDIDISTEALKLANQSARTLNLVASRVI
jgi:methylase of polypeptide subunit release factors